MDIDRRRQIAKLVILVAVLVVGVWFSQTYFFLRSAVQTTGTVVETKLIKKNDGYMRLPVVEFTTEDGTVMLVQSGFTSDSGKFNKGKTVKVVYQSDDPKNAKIAEFEALYEPMFTPIFVAGWVFILIMLSVKKSFGYQKKKLEELKMRGIRVVARVKEIKENKSITVNRKHPYNLILEGMSPLDGLTKEWKSQLLWKHPQEFIQEGKEVELYIDPQKSGRYVVDLTHLPPEYFKIVKF